MEGHPGHHQLDASFLEFMLPEDMGMTLLDEPTLAAVCSLEEQHQRQQQLQRYPGAMSTALQQQLAFQQQQQSVMNMKIEDHLGAGPSSASRKRDRAADLEEDLDASSGDDEEDGRASTGGKRTGRKGAGGKAGGAAPSKACREKKRREKINDRFADLTKLMDPMNELKTDKYAILVDAIRFIKTMQVENGQLKQLNKFLEERVSHFERERGQQLYQQSLLLQQQQAQFMSGMHLQQQAAQPPGLQAPSAMALMTGPLHPSTSSPSLMSAVSLGQHPHLSTVQHQHQQPSSQTITGDAPGPSSLSSHPHQQLGMVSLHGSSSLGHPSASGGAAQMQQQQQQQQQLSGSYMQGQGQLQSQLPLVQGAPSLQTLQAQAQMQQALQHPMLTSSMHAGMHAQMQRQGSAHNHAQLQSQLHSSQGQGQQQQQQQPSGTSSVAAALHAKQHSVHPELFPVWLTPSMLDSNQDSLLRPPAA